MSELPQETMRESSDRAYREQMDALSKIVVAVEDVEGISFDDRKAILDLVRSIQYKKCESKLSGDFFLAEPKPWEKV